MNRWLVALVAAALLTGGAAGWALRGQPPAPQVRHEEKGKVDLRIKENHTASAKSNTESLQTIGPSEIKRKATKYHPPAPLLGCTDGKAPCNCPAPATGPVAEVVEETVNTGPGSILISKNQESTAASSRELKLLQELETLRLQKPPELSRFTGGGGVAIPVVNPRDVAPVVSLSARLFGVTTRAALKVPPMHLAGTELIVTAEVPL